MVAGPAWREPPLTPSADEARAWIEAELAKALAPFDENKEVPRYVKYTREQLIEEGREEIAKFRDTRYAEWLANPAAYIEGTTNITHLEYLAGGGDALTNHPDPAVRTLYAKAIIAHEESERALPARLRDNGPRTPLTYEESFPAKLEWTDDQVHEYQLTFVEDYNIGADGEVYSEYNPDSQWDWYSIGGRWAGYWKVIEQAADTTELSHAAWADRAFPLGTADQEYVDERNARPGRWVDVARKHDIEFEKDGATYAFLDSDGKWHQKGRMGWFGISSDEKVQEAWESEYTARVEAEADNAWFVLVDCHI